MDKKNSMLNTILLILTIASVSFTLVQNFKPVKEAIGFPDKPNWEGHWKMKIGTTNIGETETILRSENGMLIGSYSIYGSNKSVLSTQMTGYVTTDNIYKGNWFQMSDSTFQANGKFTLILKDNHTFQGIFTMIRKDGKLINDIKWTGEKVK